MNIFDAVGMMGGIQAEFIVLFAALASLILIPLIIVLITFIVRKVKSKRSQQEN